MRLVEGASVDGSVYNFGILPRTLYTVNVPQLGPRVGQSWDLDRVLVKVLANGPGAYFQVNQGRLLHSDNVIQTADDPLAGPANFKLVPFGPADGEKQWAPATIIPHLSPGDTLSAALDVFLHGSAPALTTMFFHVSMQLYGERMN